MACVWESQGIMRLEKKKQLKPCGWQITSLRVVEGFIVVCQPAEGFDDGSLLGTLYNW